MKTDEMKIMVNSLKELNESYVDLLQAVKGTIREVKTTRQLWRDGGKSKLVKLGLALIVFPEPTPISETVGTALIASGTVQEGIRRRSLYIEDVYKIFQNVLREVWTVKQDV